MLETAAELASRAGQVGRAATLHLGALQLARRHRSLAGRRAGLEDQAIEELFRADRWSELDPLVRDAWPRRAALPQAQRAHLAAAFSAHSVLDGVESSRLSRWPTDELASLEEGGGLDQGAGLLREAALIAWIKADGADARAFVDRAVDVARRTGDLDVGDPGSSLPDPHRLRAGPGP